MEHVEFIDLNNDRSGIYCIFNVRDGKLYIGSAVILKNRISKHIRLLKSNKHSNCHLQRAWNRDGIISFLFILMEYCEVENLIEREQYWFSQFDFKNQLYNLCPTAGSTLGMKVKEETKIKLKNTLKIVFSTEEYRERIKKSHIGLKHSEATRQKMRENSQAKRVSQINKETGETLATFRSIAEAAAATGNVESGISLVCTGKRKSTGGYRWQFATIENQN